MTERSFDIVVDKVPYTVKVIPFEFNGETRFNVSYNGGHEHVFTWDSNVGQLRAIDNDAATLPDDVEIAIAQRLRSGRY